MGPGPASSSAPGHQGTDTWFPWAVGIFAVVVVAAWAGGALASVMVGGPVPALADAAVAVLRLPATASAPAAAWPAGSLGSPGPLLYWSCQLSVLAASAAAAVASWRTWKRLVPRPPGALGVPDEGRIAQARDLGRLAVRQPVAGRVTLGRSAGRLVACEAQASLAVIGPSGCGKSAGFAIPALLEWRGPIIATSVKSDLLEAAIAHRRRRGTVWVYDPTGASRQPSDHWSPLSECVTWQGAIRVASWMVEAAQPAKDSVSDSDYWYSQARKALAPYLFAAGVAGAGIGELVGWIDTQERGQVEEILQDAVNVTWPVVSFETADPVAQGRWFELWMAAEAMCRSYLRALGGDAARWAQVDAWQWPSELYIQVADAVDDEWQREAAAIAAGEKLPVDLLAPLVAARALWSKEVRLRGSVFATVENVLWGWADPGVTRCATEADVDLAKWLSGDNTIFVVATADEQSRLRPVLTLLMQQAIRAAYNTANRSGGTLARPCLVLIDEAGNTTPLRDLPSYASTARSHGITLITVWQDMAQITAAYKDRAQTVINNHRAKLFGNAIADPATLEYVSRLVGDENKVERNVSVDLTGGRRSVSEHQTYRRAAPADVIRRLPENEALLLYGAELPVHVRLRPWFDERSLRAIARRDDLIRDYSRANQTAQADQCDSDDGGDQPDGANQTSPNPTSPNPTSPNRTTKEAAHA